MRRTRILAIVGVVLLYLGYLVSQYEAEQTVKRSSITAYNRDSSGLSVFHELLSQLHPRSIRLKKDPLLDEDQLERVSHFAIISPLAPLSSRERKVLGSFVKEGGTLILAFHDRQSFVQVRSLLIEAGKNLDIQESRNFKNGSTVEASPGEDLSVFRAGEKYSFYSSLVFVTHGPAPVSTPLPTPLLPSAESPSCTDNGEFACYVTRIPSGKGSILILAGLPFFSNVMINREANSRAAFRLANEVSTLVLDEYRHFFSDKTLYDLLVETRFLVTLIGLFAITLLFFVFGHTEFHERSLLPKPEEGRKTFHDLNERILLQAVDQRNSYPQALDRQIHFLKRIFPTEVPRLEKLADSLDTGTTGNRPDFLHKYAKLIQFHKECLEKQRRLPT